MERCEIELLHAERASLLMLPTKFANNSVYVELVGRVPIIHSGFPDMPIHAQVLVAYLCSYPSLAHAEQCVGQ